MRVTLFALAMLGAVLAVAPTADGFSSGSKGSRGSGSSFSGTTGGGGNVSQPNGGGGTTTAATPEPLAALAVGLGLLGARYLRRR